MAAVIKSSVGLVSAGTAVVEVPTVVSIVVVDALDSLVVCTASGVESWPTVDTISVNSVVLSLLAVVSCRTKVLGRGSLDVTDSAVVPLGTADVVVL